MLAETTSLAHCEAQALKSALKPLLPRGVSAELQQVSSAIEDIASGLAFGLLVLIPDDVAVTVAQVQKMVGEVIKSEHLSEELTVYVKETTFD